MREQLPDPRETGRYYALAQVGLEMVAPLLIGLWLDYQFGWTPWALVAGAVLGFAGGIAHLVIMAQNIEQERAAAKKKQN